MHMVMQLHNEPAIECKSAKRLMHGSVAYCNSNSNLKWMDSSLEGGGQKTNQFMQIV